MAKNERVEQYVCNSRKSLLEVASTEKQLALTCLSDIKTNNCANKNLDTLDTCLNSNYWDKENPPKVIAIKRKDIM
jgi:hypothetical protein